jgi:hypothetical protein
MLANSFLLIAIFASLSLSPLLHSPFSNDGAHHAVVALSPSKPFNVPARQRHGSGRPNRLNTSPNPKLSKKFLYKTLRTTESEPISPNLKVLSLCIQKQMPTNP